MLQSDSSTLQLKSENMYGYFYLKKIVVRIEVVRHQGKILFVVVGAFEYPPQNSKNSKLSLPSLQTIFG